MSKKYDVRGHPGQSLIKLLSTNGRRRREVWALRDINLEVPMGSTVGIIGHNGAGKSTLLKLLSGLTQPTSGSIVVNGRVTSVLQLGAGMRPDFTGRANLYMNCSLLGMTKKETEEKFEEIVDFAELQDFIDLPLKTYSQGMKMRLNFAISTSLDPDILLIDEVLAVGDEYFKGKCYRRLNEFREKGKTLVVVSHSMYTVRSLCDTVFLLSGGRIVARGKADDVIDEYLRIVHEQRERAVKDTNRKFEEKKEQLRWGSGDLSIGKVTLRDGSGKERYVFHTNEKMVIEARYRVSRTVKNPVFGIGIFRSDGTYVTGVNHLWHRNPVTVGELPEGKEGVVSCAIEDLPLLKGSYYISYYCYNHDELLPSPVDHLEKGVLFQVEEGRVIEHGMVSIPTAWRIS